MNLFKLPSGRADAILDTIVELGSGGKITSELIVEIVKYKHGREKWLCGPRPRRSGVN